MLVTIMAATTVSTSGSVGRLFGAFFNIKYEGNFTQLVTQIKDAVDNAGTMSYKTTAQLIKALFLTYLIP